MAVGFSVTIRAVDLVTGTLQRINRQLIQMQAPWMRLSNAWNRFSNLSGITRIVTGFNNLARSALSAAFSITRIVGPLSALSGIGSLAGIYKMVEGYANLGRELNFASLRIPTTAANLAVMQGAARYAGVSAETLTSSLIGLKQTLFDIVGGRAPEATVMLNTLGIALRDKVTGGARDATEVLSEVANKVQQLSGNPAAQERVLQALGISPEMLPYLRLGAAGIAHYVEVARRAGPMTQDMIDRANQLAYAQGDLHLAVDGLANTLADKLQPYLMQAVTWMTRWIEANRVWLGQEFERRVQDFVTWLKSVDWDAQWTGVKHVATGINDIATAMGGWKNVGEAIALYFGTVWVAAILKPFWMVLRLLALIPGSGVAAAALATAAGLIDIYNRPTGAVQKNEGDELERYQPRYVAPGTPGPGRRGRVALPGSPEGRPPPYMPNDPNPDFNPMLPGGALPLSETPRGPGGSVTPPAQNAGSDAIASYIADRFQAAGYTQAQAAGVLGNVQRESGFDPANQGDENGAARGLFQIRDSRLQEFVNRYHSLPNRSNVQQQVDFALEELRTTEGAAADSLRASRTSREAGETFSTNTNTSRGFERPFDPYFQEAKRRGSDAEVWERRLQARRGGGVGGLAPGLYDGGAQGMPAELPPGGLGARTSGTDSIKGSASLSVRFLNTPPGTQIASDTRGSLWDGPPRIERSMTGALA